MNPHKQPFSTLGLLAITAAIHLLAPDPSVLWFGTAEIAQGETWRILTGHMAHADLNHLLWNLLGLAILGWLIERRSRRLLWASLATGTAAVSLLLLSPLSGLDYYCGLSGVLNSLLVVALWLEWRSSGSWWVAAVALACLLKALWETAAGDSLITQISWPPFALSHLAGMTGGLVLLMWGRIRLNQESFGKITLEHL